MIKISKSSNKQIDCDLMNKIGILDTKEAKRIVDLPIELSEDNLTEERDMIEKCAQNSKTYYYNSKWNNQIVSHLKEYASVCNCNIMPINPSDKNVIAASEIQDETMIKTASTASTKQSLVLEDPFKLDKEYNEAIFKKSNEWEKLNTESKLDRPNTLTRSSSVLRIGGGEDYFVNPHLNVKRGQNSVTSPNAIEDIVNNKEEDVGERIREEKVNKANCRKAEIKAQEERIIEEAAAQGFGAFSQRTVHLTESLNAQPGIRGENAFDLDRDDKTVGETLKEQNQERKASIQRTKEENKEWDKPQPQSIHEISDVFTESLKNNLSKIKK